MSKESIRRYRARLRGEDAPLQKSGPKAGFKQSPEHIANKVKGGAGAQLIPSTELTVKSGRSRAQRLYRDIGPCKSCGAEVAERHHIDGDTGNNSLSNIAIVCRRCHMETDGRLESLIESRRQAPASVYAGAHRNQPREKGKFVQGANVVVAEDEVKA